MPGVSVIFTWDYLGQMVGIRGWHVYVGDDPKEKGTRWGCCLGPEPRKAAVTVEEGTWVLRAVPVGADDQEAPNWQECPSTTVFAHGRDQIPAAPVRAAAAFVEPSSCVRVALQPVSMETVPGTVEVIALPHGTHAAQGKLLGTFRIERADLIDADPTRGLSALIPLEGRGVGATKTIAMRVLSDTGQPGEHVEVDVASPPRPSYHPIVIASIDRATGGRVGFAAASADTGYEYGAGYGARLRTLPTFDTMTDGLFDSLERIAPFVTNAAILSAERDLGAEMTYVLEIADEIERADRYGAWDIEPMMAFGEAGSLSPSDVSAIRRTDEDGGGWLWREYFMDGTPRRPIRPENARWCYWVSATSPVTVDDAHRIEYVPGAVVKGRYIVVGAYLREPMGMHQLVTGDVLVRALVLNQNTTGTGSPEAVVQGVPGDEFTQTNGPPSSYRKVTGVGTTGWVASTEIGTTAVTALAGNTLGGVAPGAGFLSLVSGASVAALRITLEVEGLIVKPTDEIKTNNNTLGDDSSLKVSMLANTKYEFEADIWFDTQPTPDFQYAINGPATPTLVRISRRHCAAGGTPSEQAPDVAYTGAVALTGAGTTGGHVRFTAIVHNGANAGFFAFQWAQNTADIPGQTIVRAGSRLRWRVA